MSGIFYLISILLTYHYLCLPKNDLTQPWQIFPISCKSSCILSTVHTLDLTVQYLKFLKNNPNHIPIFFFIIGGSGWHDWCWTPSLEASSERGLWGPEEEGPSVCRLVEALWLDPELGQILCLAGFIKCN